MSNQDISLVFVTAPNREVATTLAEALVSRRIAACVSLIPGIESVYRWEGTIERASEVQLLIKTTPARLPELERCVAELHPYSTPELISIPAGYTTPRYLQWVLAETGDG